MTTPYLLRFKRECVAPRRSTPDDHFYYDQQLLRGQGKMAYETISSEGREDQCSFPFSNTKVSRSAPSRFNGVG